MNESMKLGYLTALYMINEEMKIILLELNKNGLSPSRDFETLVYYVHDKIVESVNEGD